MYARSYQELYGVQERNALCIACHRNCLISSDRRVLHRTHWCRHPLPRREDPPRTVPRNLWDHQLRTPEGPLPNWLSHIEESRRSFVDRILPKANFGYSRFSVPFPLQNVSEGKGFVGELEISVTYTTMKPPYRSGLLFSLYNKQWLWNTTYTVTQKKKTRRVKFSPDIWSFEKP